jgi:tetratricopeptide (TPR) repeat protein
MFAACRSSLRTAALIAALAPATALAQIEPQGATNPNVGKLIPATKNAAAVAELRAAFEDFFVLRNATAAQHTARALELDSTFGLARAFHAYVVGGRPATADAQRAAVDAANGSAAEALFALGVREQNAGRIAVARRLYTTAMELAPNDRDVALFRANNLPDTQRVNAIRQVVTKFPDDAAAKMFLAFYLIPIGQDSTIRANGDEALRVAGESVRLAPRNSGSHTVMAHVLFGLRRYAEAQQHVTAAISLKPASFFAYELQAQLAAFDGRFTDMRTALDSSVDAVAQVGRKFGNRRARAFVALSEGNPQQAMSELAQQAKDAEAIDARGQVAQSHFWMAFVAAATRDSAGVEQHLAAGRAFDSTATTVADAQIVAYSLAGIASGARRALGDYIRVSGPQPNLSADVNATRATNLHRMTGLVLVAEKKPQEAITELRQGGTNPYATLGIIEAYRQMKNTKQADAERTAFFERKEFSYVSSATPIIRYRALKK